MPPASSRLPPHHSIASATSIRGSVAPLQNVWPPDKLSYEPDAQVHEERVKVKPVVCLGPFADFCLVYIGC